MGYQIKEASIGQRVGRPPYSDSHPSSRTLSPSDNLSEQTSKHENSSSELESPPPELLNHCSQFCVGLWNGCSYGEHHQLNCHLRCSPRSCKQCREVADADWIRRGQWLEDCVSWEEEDEHELRETEREGAKKIIAISAIAILLAGVFYWTYRAHDILEIV